MYIYCSILPGHAIQARASSIEQQRRERLILPVLKLVM